MGRDFKKEMEKLIEQLRGFNTDPTVIDQRVKALVITKLEEALLWFGKIETKAH